MSETSPEIVVSGVPYEVLDVDGRPPEHIEDFVGDVVLTVRGRTGTHVIRGDGDLLDDGTARLHQKAGEDGGGKDIRTWCFSALPDGGFCGETV